MSGSRTYDGEQLLTRPVFRSELRAELAELELRLTLRFLKALAVQMVVVVVVFTLR